MHNRIYGLDLLRAFAVLTVVYSHGLKFVYDKSIRPIYSLLIFDGVSMFFVLSGFLIGGILLKIVNKPTFEARELWDFWVRRWFRTLPTYFLVLTFLAFAASNLTANQLISYVTFTQNLFSAHPAFFPEAWSLAVEEWFYLIFPAVIFGLIKFFPTQRPKLLLAVIVFALLALTLIRIYHAIAVSIPDLRTWDRELRKVVVYRLDALMYGVLGAWGKFYAKEIFFHRKKYFFVLGLGLIFADKIFQYGSHNIEYLKYVGLSVMPIATLLLLPMLSTIRTGSGMIFRTITLISAISYSMYLLNLSPVLTVIMPPVLSLMSLQDTLSPVTAGCRYLLFWGITVGGAIILHYWFEKPVTALRDRYAKPEPRQAKEEIPQQEDCLPGGQQH